MRRDKAKAWFRVACGHNNYSGMKLNVFEKMGDKKEEQKVEVEKEEEDEGDIYEMLCLRP